MATLESSVGGIGALTTRTTALESSSTTEAGKVSTLESTSTSEATKLATAEGTIASEAAKGKSNFYFSFVEIILFNQLIISFSFFVIPYL